MSKIFALEDEDFIKLSGLLEGEMSSEDVEFFKHVIPDGVVEVDCHLSTIEMGGVLLCNTRYTPDNLIYLITEADYLEFREAVDSQFK